MRTKIKREKRFRRHKRVRKKIFGTAARPRLFIFRSNQHIYAQLINDEKGRTLASASDLELKSTKKTQTAIQGKTRKEAVAYRVGKLIAKKTLEKKIEKIVFDRSGYKYHGRVRALAEGARAGGLKF